MAFQTIHTLYGLTQLSRAEATGTPINLPYMAVGDGNGNPTEPTETQTQLVRERYRADVNRVYQDSVDPLKFSAELVIPASVGGFTLREMGLFDAAGSLFAVGNLPETYKPNSEEGAFSDTVVRLDFRVDNAALITLIADPNVVVVTQQWVTNNVTAAMIIPGGTVGQFLSKETNEDGAFRWVNPEGINVTVDTVAEKQLLAAGQTLVDLSVTTTYGLAVYIDGLRLDLGSAAGEWQPAEGNPTRIVLGKSYPAGTRITLVNNEPAGSAPAPLERGQNLADVLDKTQARKNLDIFSREETRQMAPVGQYGFFERSTAPPGWLKANGAAVSRSVYAELFAVLGTRHGAGDGFTTFNLPDRRGEFPRGWDDGRGVDGGRELGSWQGDSLQSHTHSGSSADAGNHSHSGSATSAGSHNHSASSGAAGEHAHSVAHGTTTFDGGSSGHRAFMSNGNNLGVVSTGTSAAGNHAHSVSIGNAGAHSHSLSINSGGTHQHGITIGSTGGAETRPRNFAALICIKY